MLSDLPKRHADILLEYYNMSIVKSCLKCKQNALSSHTVISHVLGEWVSFLSYVILIRTTGSSALPVQPEGTCVYIRQSTSACGISVMYHIAHAG